MITKWNGHYPKAMCYECHTATDQTFGTMVSLIPDKIEFVCDNCIASLPSYNKDSQGFVTWTDGEPVKTNHRGMVVLDKDEQLEIIATEAEAERIEADYVTACEANRDKWGLCEN